MFIVAEDGGEVAIPVWIGRALAGVIVLFVGWWALRPTGSKEYQRTPGSRSVATSVRCAVHTACAR